MIHRFLFVFFFQAEDGIRDGTETGVQTCALPILLDETEFLSSYGVRALSRYHEDHPYEVHVNGNVNRVAYEPAESTTGLFGGNSNWRGPIWFPVNYLLVESLQKFHHYYGEDFKVECPTH